MASILIEGTDLLAA